MNTTDIQNALAAKGLDAIEVETVKNGIVCKGYQIDNGTNVKPVIYYSSDETVEAFADRAAKIATMPVPNFDTDNLISKKRLLNNTILCLQKQGSEPIVKRDFLNLELYVRLGVDFGDADNKGSIKVTHQILEQAGLTEDELFDAARTNSLKKVSIASMAEVLGLSEIPDDIPFFVGTYDDRCHGAGILAMPEVINEFCEDKGFDNAYIIPSSTEEILILSTDTVEDPATLANMVAEVNDTTVDPTLRLENCVYQFDTETQEVSIVSIYKKEV
jgi:hypothetical protein